MAHSNIEKILGALESSDDDLNSVCYEHIKDKFAYGLFGDLKLVIDKKTAYFNATKLCETNNKSFEDWGNLPQTKQLFEHYELNWLGPDHVWSEDRLNNVSCLVYEVKFQDVNKLTKQVTGMYVPPDLLLNIASWISPDFYTRCNNIIVHYFIECFENMSMKSIEDKVEEIEDQLEKLALKKDEIIKEKTDQTIELKQIIARLEAIREKDRQIILRQEQHMLSLGIIPEGIEDDGVEALLSRPEGDRDEVLV